MQVTTERPDQAALTIDKSASALGLHEFSLLSRIQAGEIKSARARSGEMVIPESELERLARTPVNTLVVPSPDLEAKLSDERLGIKWQYRGLTTTNGDRSYTVPAFALWFTEGEIKGYRAAFGAIAGELESVTALKTQLDKPGHVPAPADKEIQTPQIGQWQVRSRLLNLGQSEVLLCQRENEFAVIERFQADSPYAKANGNAEILMQGSDARQLTEDFNADARLTLEFMGSNLTAKAQKIAWEQFPDHRPGRIVAAVSNRCRHAVANEETISHDRKHSVRRGIGV